MNDDYNAIAYQTNTENVIKVYMKKRKPWLTEKEIAVLYDKSIETIKGIISNIISSKKYRRHYEEFNGIILYDIKIIEEVGKILDSKNGLLLKVSIKEKIGKDRNYNDMTGWYILDILVDIIFEIFD